jgi:hypothetical protein
MVTLMLIFEILKSIDKREKILILTFYFHPPKKFDKCFQNFFKRNGFSEINGNQRVKKKHGVGKRNFLLINREGELGRFEILRSVYFYFNNIHFLFLSFILYVMDGMTFSYDFFNCGR